MFLADLRAGALTFQTGLVLGLKACSCVAPRVSGRQKHSIVCQSFIRLSSLVFYGTVGFHLGLLFQFHFLNFVALFYFSLQSHEGGQGHKAHDPHPGRPHAGFYMSEIGEIIHHKKHNSLPRWSAPCLMRWAISGLSWRATHCSSSLSQCAISDFTTSATASSGR